MDLFSFIPLSDRWSFAAVSGIGLVLIVLLVMLLSKPIGKMLKLLIHGAFGFVLLFAINYFVHIEALHLDLNLANCIVAGIGGVPGVILLLLFQHFVE